MPTAERSRQPDAEALGRAVAALLAGEADVPSVDPRTDARIRAVVDRLVTARRDLEAGPR